MNRLRLFNAIVVSMLVAGILLVALALATVKALDRRVIEAAAARNRHAEFLLAASVVSRAIDRPEELRSHRRMKPILDDIQQLRPGIRALEILELTGGSATSVMTTGSQRPGVLLSDGEIQELRRNNVLSRFDDVEEDRAWLFTVPIVSNGMTVGALRGRFSVSKYDQLIVAQEDVAKHVAVGAVIVTSLIMLLLIRIQLHRPIARLLNTMEAVRSGHLNLEAPISGPLEIRRLAENFNQMMAQLHMVMSDKEQLVRQIQALNSNLESRVEQAVRELDRERDKVAAAQLAAQRNSNLAALGEVSAMMAHELGNPLNALYGRLQLMKQSDMNDETARHLDVIKAQVARMSDVIHHVLKSTRVEGESSPVLINDLVGEVLALLQAPTINVVTRLAPSLPPVEANKTSLHGVILNLVSNAVQAMTHGGELSLTTSMADNRQLGGHVLVRAVSFQRPMVRLAVQDTGAGISGLVLDKICEPFFTTRHEAGGTGLGLAICRRVVTSVGGQLAVQSVLGKGTTFTVDLPAWTDRR